MDVLRFVYNPIHAPALKHAVQGLASPRGALAQKQSPPSCQPRTDLLGSHTRQNNNLALQGSTQNHVFTDRVLISSNGSSGIWVSYIADSQHQKHPEVSWRAGSFGCQIGFVGPAQLPGFMLPRKSLSVQSVQPFLAHWDPKRQPEAQTIFRTWSTLKGKIVGRLHGLISEVSGYRLIDSKVLPFFSGDSKGAG